MTAIVLASSLITPVAGGLEKPKPVISLAEAGGISSFLPS
jgi:hypothetical protein